MLGLQSCLSSNRASSVVYIVEEKTIDSNNYGEVVN